MSHFAAYFPGVDQPGELPPTLRSLQGFYKEVSGADFLRLDQLQGSFLLTTGTVGNDPQVFIGEAGWIVVHGVVFRVDTPNPQVDLPGLFRELVENEQFDLNRLEGNFALAAWDSRRRRGLVFNDQGAVMNLYYIEHDGGLYVTTTALAIARAAGLTLEPHGVQEFLSAGVLWAPRTLFRDLYRLNVGEHVRYQAGTGLRRRRHWLPYREPAAHRTTDEAATSIASVLVDRVRRFATLRHPILCDLTGGLDSRLIALAGHYAGLDVKTAVWGTDDHPDVIIARRLAEAIGCRFEQFHPRAYWNAEITPAMRRQLTYQTNGEINFVSVYHHSVARPVVAQSARLHLSGFGGELGRYFPWGQEFFGIGRRRLANVANLVRYRFARGGTPPRRLFGDLEWHAAVCDRLAGRIEELCRAGGDSLTTQQCDAVYVWKMTGHASLYLSGISAWLPAVAPMLTAGVINQAVAVPWRMRLTTQLMRKINYMLCPRGAEVPTTYGGTGGPIRPLNLHRFLWQGCKQATHFAAKLDRVLWKGKYLSRYDVRIPTLPTRPYLTGEFRQFLNSATMFTRDLYAPEGLQEYLNGSDSQWLAREKIILRLATLEQICREIDFRPEKDFLGGHPESAGHRSFFFVQESPQIRPVAAQ